MKTISKLLSVVIIGLLSISANAEVVKQTLTAGYAQSKIEYLDTELDEGTGGFNVKYRMEFDHEYGVILSYTKSDYEESGTYSGVDIDASLDYQSIMFGPTFRANEFFSAYLLVGRASGDANLSVSSAGSASESDTSIVYGGGLQIDVTPNIVIDGSYERSKFNDVDVGTWVVGVGFSF